ncbi:MAG: NAD(P)-dependent oxidoreductase [Candidatus Pacearchaeota archaeon]
MNTLVTGSNGFLGKVLVNKLKKRGRFVVGIDKKIGQSIIQNNYEGPDVFISADIRNSNLIKEIITEYDINEVYHLASWAIQKYCAEEPEIALDININGLVNILGSCRGSKNNIESIVISTSDKAFGNAPVPYTEESPLMPLFIYDTTKACQQMISMAYSRNYNLPIKVIASSNFYGPGDFNITRIIPNSIIRLSMGLPAMIWKDSEKHVREFIYIDDVAEGFIAVSEKGKKGELYCCGGKEHLTIKDLVTKICTIMGKEPKKNIKIVERPVYLKELQKQYLNSSKLQSLGWQQKILLDEGLKRSIDFYTRLVEEHKIHPMRAKEDGSITYKLKKYFS